MSNSSHVAMLSCVAAVRREQESAQIVGYVTVSIFTSPLMHEYDFKAMCISHYTGLNSKHFARMCCVQKRGSCNNSCMWTQVL